MRKTLLIATTMLLTFYSAKSQGIDKVWVLGNDATNFPVNAGIGAGPDLSVYKDGLGIHTGVVTNTNMGQVEASAKSMTIGDVTYTYVNRFKFNGGGYTGSAAGQTVPSSDNTTFYYTPAQRFLSLSVLGNSTITAHAITGSSNSERILFVTDGTQLIGSMVVNAAGTLAEYTVNYTGPAKKLYLFCNASINLYYLKVTNYDVSTSMKETSVIDGVTYNGREIMNVDQLPLEVYNSVGKLMAKSTTSINTENFQQGVYVVRTAGTNGILKFIK